MASAQKDDLEAAKSPALGPTLPCCDNGGGATGRRAIELPFSRVLITSSTPAHTFRVAYDFWSNEKEISHGRVSWQSLWTCFDLGALASSID